LKWIPLIYRYELWEGTTTHPSDITSADQKMPEMVSHAAAAATAAGSYQPNNHLHHNANAQQQQQQMQLQIQQTLQG